MAFPGEETEPEGIFTRGTRRMRSSIAGTTGKLGAAPAFGEAPHQFPRHTGGGIVDGLTGGQLGVGVRNTEEKPVDNPLGESRPGVSRMARFKFRHGTES